MTKDEAIAFSESRLWEPMTHAERFELQIREPKLCMPWDAFHEAAEAALGRPVFTHEFTNPARLIEEYEKRTPAPSIGEIIGQLPADKATIVFI